MTCAYQNGPLTAYRWTQKARAGGRHSGAPALASADLRNCAVTQEALGPLVAPAETVHPLRVCTVSAGQITATITPAAIWPPCFPLPFHSLPAALPPIPKGRGRGKDRKGMGN